MASFFERVNERIKEGQIEERIDENTAAAFGETSFDTLPTALRNRCLKNLILFVGVAIAIIILSFVSKQYTFLIGAGAVLLFGVLTTYFIIKNYKSGNVLEITGVITQKEKEGYRRQYKYASVEDDNHRVYRIMLTDRQRRYKIGDIITFYTTKDSIGRPVDAEYRVFKIYAIERFNTSISSDEVEDDKKDLNDLVVKPEEKEQ